jgi:hypothetical protein
MIELPMITSMNVPIFIEISLSILNYKKCNL